MRKLFIFISAAILSGCVTFNHKLTYWDNAGYIRTSNNQIVDIVGNPHLTCYSKHGEMLADGIFVKTEEAGYYTYLIVDEFGKDYIRVRNKQNNYCILWK